MKTLYDKLKPEFKQQINIDKPVHSKLSEWLKSFKEPHQLDLATLLLIQKVLLKGKEQDLYLYLNIFNR